MEIRHVRFRMSGGFAGVVRGTDMDGADLSAAERRALETHLEEGIVARDANARDTQVYELEAATSEGERRIEFDDLNVPEKLGDLVDRLSAASRPIHL